LPCTRRRHACRADCAAAHTLEGSNASEEPDMTEDREARPNRPDEDWWHHHFGSRGIIQIIFGREIEPILVIIFAITLCCLLLSGKDGLLGSFMNMMFFIVGHYFRRIPGHAGDDG
jgi:hypothetical protein